MVGDAIWNDRPLSMVHRRSQLRSAPGMEDMGFIRHCGSHHARVLGRTSGCKHIGRSCQSHCLSQTGEKGSPSGSTHRIHYKAEPSGMAAAPTSGKEKANRRAQETLPGTPMPTGSRNHCPLETEASEPTSWAR